MRTSHTRRENISECDSHLFHLQASLVNQTRSKRSQLIGHDFYFNYISRAHLILHVRWSLGRCPRFRGGRWWWSSQRRLLADAFLSRPVARALLFVSGREAAANGRDVTAGTDWRIFIAGPKWPVHSDYIMGYCMTSHFLITVAEEEKVGEVRYLH